MISSAIKKLRDIFKKTQSAPVTYDRIPDYHEAGHTLFAVKNPCLSTLEYITTIEDDNSYGHTEFFYAGTPENEKEVLGNQILMLVSGRAASETYTGQEDRIGWYEGDYESAKRIINRMIDQNYYIKPDRLSTEEFYTQILNTKLQEAKQFMVENRGDLDLLVNYLHKRNTLSRKDVFELLNLEDNICVIPEIEQKSAPVIS